MDTGRVRGSETTLCGDAGERLRFDVVLDEVKSQSTHAWPAHFRCRLSHGALSLGGVAPDIQGKATNYSWCTHPNPWKYLPMLQPLASNDCPTIL